MKKFRVWYKFDGKLDSCIVSAASKKEVRELMKENLPSAKVGIIDAI